MQLEKMNSSLQQRNIEYKKEKEIKEYIEKDNKNKKKSLREMFEEEIKEPSTNKKRIV